MADGKKPRAERRRWPVGYDPRKEARQIRADERRGSRGLRSNEQQVELARTRRGRSKREIARLMQPLLGDSALEGRDG